MGVTPRDRSAALGSRLGWTAAGVLLSIGIAVLINVLASSHAFRLDVTATGRLALSPRTMGVLERSQPGTEIVLAPTDPDRRDYNVRFDKIGEELGFEASYSIDDGIREVVEALRNGDLDASDRRWYTLRQYVFLTEVERTYANIALDGHVLSSS